MPLFLDILWRQTEGDPDLRRRAFQGLRKYQEATRPAPPPSAAVFAKAGSATLLHYGDSAAKPPKRAPVIFIPSLINPPRVLDLSERHSMLRSVSTAGHDAYLVDWGTPTIDDATLDLAGHVTERLIPMLATLPRPPILVGYCLGGSLALGAARSCNARAVVTIAAPWDFNGFPAKDREEVVALWRKTKPVCQRLGYVPMEVLQSGFWAMDPARTIFKYAAFADMPAGSDKERAFLAVEDWANEGPPLTFAAARDLFENFYAQNHPAEGNWIVDGKAVSIAGMPCPSLSIASTTDRIVPALASPSLDETRLLQVGHVGMIVGSNAQDMLWNSLSDWLSYHGG